MNIELSEKSHDPLDNQWQPVATPYSVDFVMESMRGIAALWVFAFHISAMVQAAWPAAFGVANQGHRGVPMFFVISGYCIFAAAQKTAGGASGACRSFLKKRVLRIFPPFWVSIVLVLILPFVIEMIASIKSGNYVAPNPAWTAYSALDWIAISTLTKDIVDSGSQVKSGYTLINSVYWTLAIEIQFYLIVFLALLFKTYWKQALAVITVLSVITLGGSFEFANGFFLPFWPAFAMGIGLRLSHTYGFAPAAFFGRQELILSLFAALTTVCLGVYIFNLASDLSFTVSAALAAAFLWCLGGVEHALRYRPYFNRIVTNLLKRCLLPLVMLGQCSYSLYLLHGKLFHLPEMFVRQIIRPESPAYLLLVVVLTTVLCYGFFILIERPFQRFQPRIKSSLSPPANAGQVAS